MATLLAIRFPWGRYHATPWGRYVNEGTVELPPSPWRLLRALYATWRMRVPDLGEAVVYGLLAELVERPPTYLLPPYRLAHTRHYYPDSQHRTGKISVDRDVDAFAIFPRGAQLVVGWGVELDAEQKKALSRLARSLPYLGRADSICDAHVLDNWPDAGRYSPAVPLDVEEELPPGTQRAELLTPTMPLDLGALTLRPVEVRAKKLLYPPGTHLLPYAVPETTQVQRSPRPPIRRRKVPAVRLTLTAAARPPLSEAVAVAELLRNACVKQLNELRGHEHADSLLVGKNGGGKASIGHRHAHYIALDADGDWRIDELAVWAPGELDDDELEAIARTRILGAHERQPGPRKAELRISGLGPVRDIVPELVGPARCWESVTPFCPPRHRKGRWSEFLAAEVCRELGYRGHPEPAIVRPLGTADWAGFVRYRPQRDGSRAKSRPGGGLRLEFECQVEGPLLLGALSHFGLGMFWPTD
ncbi:MAG: type I-G CRISPR-associated protein Csb2 [Nocardioidaceae bacterium]